MRYINTYSYLIVIIGTLFDKVNNKGFTANYIIAIKRKIC